MTSRERIEKAAEQYGWAVGETLTGAATYRRLSGRLIDLSGPQIVVWYDVNDNVKSVEASPRQGLRLLALSGGRDAVVLKMRVWS